MGGQGLQLAPVIHDEFFDAHDSLRVYNVCNRTKRRSRQNEVLYLGFTFCTFTCEQEESKMASRFKKEHFRYEQSMKKERNTSVRRGWSFVYRRNLGLVGKGETTTKWYESDSKGVVFLDANVAYRTKQQQRGRTAWQVRVQNRPHLSTPIPGARREQECRVD